MVMPKNEWMQKATKLNPNRSPEFISRVYDDYVATPTPVNQGTQPTTEDAKINPDGLALKSHGKKTAYYDNTTQNEAVNNIVSTNQSAGENKKQIWMQKATKLNPNRSPEFISRVYDDYVSSPDRQNVDQMEQLAAIKKMNDHLYRNNKPTEENDPDEAKAGFDSSDKMSMIGSSLLGLTSGALQSFMGVANLALKLPDHYGLLPKGFELHTIKDRQNRLFNQSKLLQEAYKSHPTVTNISNMIGSIVPMVVGGETALPLAAAGVAEKAGTMFEAVKNIPGIAQAITASPEIIEKLGLSAVKNGAKKFMTKVLPLIRHGAEGGFYGASAYDPRSDTEMKNATAGAIGALALHGGGKIVKNLYSKLTPEIEQAMQRYGITLPVMPRLNSFLSSIPILGNGVRTAGTQKEYIDNIANQVANKISPIAERESTKRSQYGKFLVGKLRSALDENVKTAGKMYDKVADKSAILAKTKKLIDLTNVRESAANLLQEEKLKLPSLKNASLGSVLSDFSTTPDLSYKALNINRQTIGEEVGATVGREEGSYKTLYKNISESMDNYAQEQGSEIKKLHDEANKFYKEKVVPYKYGKWKKYIASDYDTDNFLKDFLKPEHPGRIQDILSALPEKESSLTAARASIVHSALDDASLPTGGFNPEKFVNNMTKLGETNDVVFTQEQQDSIDGYRKLLQLTRKLSPKWLQDMPKTETLAMLRHGEVLGTGGTMLFLTHAYPHLTIPIFGSAIGFTRLLTSTPGRKLLLELSKFTGKLSDKKIPSYIQRAARVALSQNAPSLSAGL